MSVASADERRLFPDFLDPVDMIGRFSSAATLREVNEQAEVHGLRFPLVADPDRTLAEHLDVLEYAPASARFGAFADNVTGMNWELPSGHRVRVGERVVKSTTGYDLQRFLLHARGRFGQATEFVLRLRPRAAEFLHGRFEGSLENLMRLAGDLRGSSWIHWIDEVNIDTGMDHESRLTVSVNCLKGESKTFSGGLQEFARKSGTTFERLERPMPVVWPVFSIKSLPGQALELARRCVSDLGGQARVLVVNGYILLAPERRPEDAWLRAIGEELAVSGGHVFGNSLQTLEMEPLESSWLEQLENHWRTL